MSKTHSKSQMKLGKARKRKKAPPSNGFLFMERIHGKEEMHSRFVDAYIRTQSATQAVREVYGDTIRQPDNKGMRLLRKPEVLAMLKKRIGTVGATPEKAAKLIADAMTATKFVGPDHLEVPDHSIRLKAADFIFKIFGAYADGKNEGNVGTSEQLDYYLKQPAKVKKFIIEHGREPTEEERRALYSESKS